jgi:hypothetical protein
MFRSPDWFADGKCHSFAGVPDYPCVGKDLCAILGSRGFRMIESGHGGDLSIQIN